MLDIERFRKINIGAHRPEEVYFANELAPERNVDFLKRCARLIAIINFADYDTGRIYARLEHGKWTWCDEQRFGTPDNDEPQDQVSPWAAEIGKIVPAVIASSNRDVSSGGSHARTVDRSHSWAAVSVLDADVTMRFWEARLLPFELLLPPTCFSTRLVSASWLVAFVHFVRGPRIIISDHLVGFSAKEGLFMFAKQGARRHATAGPQPLRLQLPQLAT